MVQNTQTHGSRNSMRNTTFRDISRCKKHHNRMVLQRILIERVRCIRLEFDLSKSFWIEAMNMACYLLN